MIKLKRKIYDDLLMWKKRSRGTTALMIDGARLSAFYSTALYIVAHRATINRILLWINSGGSFLRKS